MTSSGDRSRTTTTRLELSFIDTTSFFLLVSSSAIDSSSQLNSNEGLAEAAAQLALLSSVGMGVFGSKVTNPNWKYVYKTTGDKNDDSHNVVASFLPPTITTATTTTEMEEETTQLVRTAITTNDSMSQEAKEVVVTKVEPITAAAAVAAIAAGDRMVEDKKLPDPSVVVAVTKTKTTTTPPPPPVVAMKPPPIVPEQGKASIPSKEILQSTEIAKVEVQKVGVAETKERMSTKSSLSPSPLEEEETQQQQLDNSPSSSSTNEVGVVGIPKRSRGKRTVKGLSLLLAAGVVALARNVVKAYLGKGMM
jgi:hypothetical protein